MTDFSTKYHNYRMYFPINIWKDTKETIKSEEWVWYVKLPHTTQYSAT